MAKVGIPDFSVIAAVNNDYIFEECLAKSPDIVSGRLNLTAIRGAVSMADAYNRGMAEYPAHIQIFAHQDVYLPQGWLDRIRVALADLEQIASDWLVAGPYGVKADGDHVGRVWDVGLGRELGKTGFEPTRVVSLDELLLITRMTGDFQFDPALPHFHLYGTDIVQTCLEMRRSAWAIEIPVVHNSQRVDSLAGGYTNAYHYVRRKWWAKLPIPTTVCSLSKYPLPLALARWRLRKTRPRDGLLLADAIEVAKLAGYEKA